VNDVRVPGPDDALRSNGIGDTVGQPFLIGPLRELHLRRQAPRRLNIKEGDRVTVRPIQVQDRLIFPAFIIPVRYEGAGTVGPIKLSADQVGIG